MISKIFFQDQSIGSFPYKNYNCSILKLTKEETLKVTNKLCNKESVIIIFFVASHHTRMGTMSFIGLISYELLIAFLQNDSSVKYENFWIIKPHLLQNDKGPKCADLRIFKLKEDIGVIGYTRIAPFSNTPNIADYYVRTSILDIRINEALYKYPDKLYHFNEIDGGCFPSNIGNNYKKFILNEKNCKINNIEFFIKDNEKSKLIIPHKSKDSLMPNEIKLNGIEVSFYQTSTNEEPTTHISTKNIVPIQPIFPPDKTCGFIDLSPPNTNNPKLTIQNVENGKVLYSDVLNVNNSFKSKYLRGSTPFVELSNKTWITMVHETNYNRSLKYKYYYQLYDNKEIIINNIKVNIPNNCIKEILFNEDDIFKNKFIFITGIIIHEQKYIDNFIKLIVLISYGISNLQSGISLDEVTLEMPNNNTSVIKSNNYIAHKQHFKKQGNNLICMNNTYLKKSLKHSNDLDENMKIKFNIGDEVRIINDFNHTYYIVNLKNNIRKFYGFWDSNEKVSNIQLTQIKIWAKSILYFHDNSKVFLYTKKNIIPNTLNIDNFKIIYMDKFEDLFIDTPLHGYKIDKKLCKPELSDIIRLVLLYKNGGTWIDIDDVVVREFPSDANILCTFLWKDNKKTSHYFGMTFNLIDGSIISNQYKNFGFHIQNDPMINWEKGNKFLLNWMKCIKNYKSLDWGQKLPTDIIKNNPKIIEQHNISLLPQHHLILHPAFGNQIQFGNPNSKGPMFPPYDLRIKGKVNYDDMITKNEFLEIVKQTLEKHDYCCVKNSKNTGIIQSMNGNDRRWFIGHLCELENIENILFYFKDYLRKHIKNIV